MEANSLPLRQSRLRSCLSSYTTANQTPLALILRILRTLILLFATANLVALFTGIEILPPFRSNHSYSFQDTSHLTANTFIFLAAIYSFLGRAEWSGVTRLTTGLVLGAWCLALNIKEIKDILDEGGCATGRAFNPGSNRTTNSTPSIKIKCRIQMTVSSLSVAWAVLLIPELFLTNIHRRRLMIKYGLDRPTELEVMPQVIHVYQPDLSLGAGENVPAAETTTTAGTTGQTEPETLPAYEPRPTGPRVHIIDMTRVSRGSPAPSESTAAGATPLPPPPSYQAPHY
ncbi:hypothetical protein EC991_010246 [Linnemannia zychae]|nr:hypothetical protein EC991_010246 [Linnemannia zychae]